MANSAVSKKETETRLRNEFDRQVENLLHKGYPKFAGMSEQAFVKNIEPLKARVRLFAAPGKVALNGHIPFVIVVKNDLVAPEFAMSRVEIKDTKGSVNMHPVEPESFKPIEGLQIPSDMIYFLVDIDTGQSTLNVTPVAALKIIRKRKRLPLTIDEGVALVTHFPQALTDKKNYNCFSMLGSRRSDQRVPAMWISYGKPRLGWCWDGNPHTWLGSASCGSRVGA